MSNKIPKTLLILLLLMTAIGVLPGFPFIAPTWAAFAATPINDLGTGLYLNQYQGGLYENGTNTVPSDHNTAGLTATGRIQPLDANGNPNAGGKIVLISIG